jgi:plastocyanin
MKRAISILALAALPLAACGGDQGNGAGGRPEHDHEGMPSADCVETSEVTALDNEFEPICVTAATGDELTITNDGAAPHTFTIEGTDVDEMLQPGDQVTATVPEGLEVEAETEFHCTIHPGMVGYLYVSA